MSEKLRNPNPCPNRVAIRSEILPIVGNSLSDFKSLRGRRKDGAG